MTEPITPGVTPSGDATRRALVFVRGRVQGVGFRWWTRARALEIGLVGHARNMADGRVEVCAQGSSEQIGALVDLLEESPSRHRRPGRVDSVVVQWHEPRTDLAGFAER